MPTLFIPHGAGPCFFMKWNPVHEWEGLSHFLSNIPLDLPDKPKALLVVSAHWEERLATVTSSTDPNLIFDYHGFPPETYQLKWPVKGSPDLADRVRHLLLDAGIESASTSSRGLDHGVFIPMLLSFPLADVPTVQLSLVNNLDPKDHLLIGKALAPLRDEGVLIIGSGFSYHNMRGFNTQSGLIASQRFDEWLGYIIDGKSSELRNQNLIKWKEAPDAWNCHPRSEHLAPIFVVAGAALDDYGKRTYNDQVLGIKTSAFKFG